MFNLYFKSEKIQNLIREGKSFKKNIVPIFEIVDEGDEMKKTMDKFLEKLIRTTKKKLIYFKIS